jgi:hypothetical protein
VTYFAGQMVLSKNWPEIVNKYNHYYNNVVELKIQGLRPEDDDL